MSNLPTCKTLCTSTKSSPYRWCIWLLVAIPVNKRLTTLSGLSVLISFIASSIAIVLGVRISTTTLSLRVWSLLLLWLLRLLLKLFPLRKRRLPISTWVVVALRSWCCRHSHKTSLSKVETLFYKDGSSYTPLRVLGSNTFTPPIIRLFKPLMKC